MGFLKKFDEGLHFIEEHIVATILFSVMVITFWGVVARFVLNDASVWAEEAARYLTVWGTFVGASLGAKKGAHIGVEAFVAFLPKKAQQYVNIVTTAICIGFCCMIAFIGYDYSIRLMQTGQLTPAMRIPIVIAYAAVPIGSALMTIRYFLVLIDQIVGLKNTDGADNRTAGGAI